MSSVSSFLQNKLHSVLNVVINWGVLLVMLILPGRLGNYTIVFSIAFGLGAIIWILNAVRHFIGDVKIFPKFFEVGTLLINMSLLIFEAVRKPSFEWSKDWIHVIINSCLLVLVINSIVLGRPFTMEFATERVHENLWKTHQFVATNYVLFWVWALQFALSVMFALLAIYVYPNNETVRTVPSILTLVGAILLTKKYPKYVKERVMKLNREQLGGSDAASEFSQL